MARVTCFLLMKWYAFAVVLAFVGDRFKSWVLDNSVGSVEILKNTGSYFLYITFNIVVFTLLFLGPFYGALRIRLMAARVICIAALLVIEYVAYTALASTSDLTLGVYNGMVTFGFLLVFFPRRFNSRIALD